MALSLKEQADKNKEFLLAQTKEYLKNNKPESLKTDREEVKAAIANGDFSKALQNLEILREAKTGITLTKIEGKDGNAPIIIRDGRSNSNESRVLGMEGFEMQYLNTVRAAIDLAADNPVLVAELKHRANIFIGNTDAQNFHNKNTGESLKNISPEEIQINISSNMTAEIDDLARLLSENGIKDAHKKLNIAKDFQNFNDEHCNIVTLSKVTDSQGKDHTVIEAEIALKGLTEEQKQQYENIQNPKLAGKWFTKMPEWEQKLVNQYAGKIKAGNHVIPTQLRQIVGMKNAFEKITAIDDPQKDDFDILHSSKHAGTLASFSRDKDLRQEITNQNAKQAKEWIGEGATLHANTLNSGPVGWGDDPDIVKQTKRAMVQTKGKITNTAFNTFRLSSYANDFSGVKRRLNDIANKLEGQEFNDLRNHIKPRGRFEKIFGINKPKGNAEELIANLRLSGKIDDQTVKVLREAVNLKNDVEKADVPIRISGDKENINLKISTDLNSLNEKITNSKDQVLSKIPKEEILTMCASGKDRTGLAEHDQTAQVIANKLSINVKDVDKQLLKNGHTAEQAGSIYAGGATIGCYGTKKENKRGIPESRKETLAPIMEVTAITNKIKGKEKDVQNHPNKADKVLDKKPEVKENIVANNVMVNKIKQSSPSQYKTSITPTATPVKKTSLAEQLGNGR